MVFVILSKNLCVASGFSYIAMKKTDVSQIKVALSTGLCVSVQEIGILPLVSFKK